MTVTIVGTNYLQITSMDTDTAGGTWDGQTPADDASSYKEGAGSMCFVMKTNGTNVTTFTPSSSVDLSGTKHVRFWMLSTHGGDFTQTELGITDGANTGYWVLASASEYPGGWYQCIIDVSKAVDSGTKPSSMNAITDFIFRVTLTGGKNAVNFWLDNLIYCDGLQAYGDDGGGAFDYEDVRVTGISSATGIISLYNGIYYLTGSITVGTTGTASSNFVAKNQTIVFVDKAAYINATLYAINVLGNSTGPTQIFQLGENSGGAGINGCNIICPNTTLAYELTATDTNVTTFGLYGCGLNTYGTIDLQPNGANLEVIGCTFTNGQGQIQPNTMTFTDNFVIGGVSTDGSVLYESTSHNISYTNYINNSRATEIAIADTYAMVGDLFTGGTHDIHFSASTGNLIINCGGNPKANPSSVENDSTGTVTINNTVNVTITVRDASDDSLVDGALVYLRTSSAAGDYPYQESVFIVSSAGTATVTHTGHGLQTDEYVRIAGANENEYNGAHQITVTGVDTYTYVVSGTPASPATGTITSTFIILFGTTSSGVATAVMRYKALDQPFTGIARRSSSTPLYKQGILSGTIENADYSTTVYLVDDE